MAQSETDARTAKILAEAKKLSEGRNCRGEPGGARRQLAAHERQLAAPEKQKVGET